jgi:protein O-mannosyl-transferase
VNQSTKPGPAGWPWRWLFGGLLLAATFLAYWPAWHGGFLWDDDSHISANPALRSLRGLWEIWFKPGATCQYYPLSFTLFWAEYQLWGLNPLGYHLLNVALHTLAAVLLWQVLERLRVRGAWLAGALFALHPVCVMSVAWMTELKNTLSATLALSAGWAYLRFAGLGVYGGAESSGDNPNRHAPGFDWRYGFLSLVLFLLAMFAKTAVSFLPATLLLIVWWQRGRLPWREIVPLLLMLMLVVTMGAVTFYIERLHGAVGTGFQLGWMERVLVSGRSFWFYLGKLFFPFGLTFVYERWAVNAAAGWQYLYPAAMVGLLVTLWWKRKAIGRGPMVALLHFFISTSLLILMVVLYMTRYTFVSDHWQYFGCMSVLALVAAGITTGLDRLGKRDWFLKPTVVGGLLLGLGLSTWRQCGMYTDIETLWQTTLDRNPDAFLAHNNLGNLLAGQGRLTKAMENYQKALAIEPNLAETHFDLGLLLVKLNRFDEAIEQYHKALELKPDYADAGYNLGCLFADLRQTNQAIAYYRKTLQINPDHADARYNLGVLLVSQNQTDQAIEHYRKALQANPDYAEAHYNLANLLAAQGRMDEAAAHYRKTIQLQPGHLGAHFNLGIVSGQQWRLEDALEHYQKAIQIKPDYAEAHYQLAIVLGVKGRLDEAIEHLQHACEINPDYAEAHYKLSAVFAAQGRTAEASQHYQIAVRLKPDYPDARNNPRLPAPSAR